ncbi:MAG: cytochrome c biogenesis protein CcdA [Fibrobacterota bacterium]
MKRLLSALLLSLFTLLSAEETVTFTQSAPPTMRPDGSITLSFTVTIIPGWHVYAHTLANDFLIPSALTLKGEGVVLDSVQYPEGVERDLMGIKDRLFEGTVTLTAFVRRTDTAATVVQAVFKSQSCNDRQCLPPSEQSVTVTLPAAPAASAASSNSSTADWLSRHGLFTGLFFLFLAGLGLNLTPCIYPVIPITLSFFTSQSGASRHRLLLLSGAYVLGIALMYSSLGTLAALTGSMLGAWLGHPAVVFTVAGLFVLLALSMFGFYEIRLPAFLTVFGMGRRGASGAVFMGLVVGVVAAPCVGPVTAGLLLYVAQKGSPLFGFASFFALSLGLGAPYFALGMLSGSLHRLPRSGGWMVWVKRFFGVVLLGMAFYYVKPLLPHATAPYGNHGLPAAALAAARTQGRPYVADFRADWCAPCVRFEREVLSDPEVKKALDGVGFYSVDLTRSGDAEPRKTAEAYRVTGVPTIIFFSRNGEETFRFTGAPEKDAFLGRLEDIKRE